MLRRRALFEKNTKTSSHKQNRKGRKHNYQGLSPGDNGSSDTEPVVVGGEDLNWDFNLSSSNKTKLQTKLAKFGKLLHFDML